MNGEFIFPLGQSGLVEGSLDGVTSIDPTRARRCTRCGATGASCRCCTSAPTSRRAEVPTSTATASSTATSAGTSGRRRARARPTRTRTASGSRASSPPASIRRSRTPTATASRTASKGARGQDRFAAGTESLRGRFSLPGGGARPPAARRPLRCGGIRAGHAAVHASGSADADGILYELVVAAGTFAPKNDKTFRYTDAGVERLQLTLGGKGGAARLKLRTEPGDLAAVSTAQRDVTVTILLGDFTVEDVRPWGPKRRRPRQLEVATPRTGIQGRPAMMSLPPQVSCASARA